MQGRDGREGHHRRQGPDRLQGPTGAKGATGAKGVTGAKGTTGANGVAPGREHQEVGRQVVTNSTTLANDTELSFTAGAGATWYVPLLLSYSGSARTGLHVRLQLSSSTDHSASSATAQASRSASDIRRATGSQPSANATFYVTGHRPANTPRTFMLQMMIRRPRRDRQFLLNRRRVVAGRTSTSTRAGSTLLARKLG